MTAGRAIGLLLGVLADGAVGDPRRALPASAFSYSARALERRLYVDHRLPGALYATGLAGGAVLLGVLAERVGRRSPVGQAAATAITTWLVLGGAGLAADGTELARHLETGDLAAARDTLATLDERCTEGLDVIALSRASVEAVAEHTCEVMVSPLVWGAIAGAPGLLAARSAALLRRRVGGWPAGPRYRRFGWFGARMAEVVQLLPTRAAAALTASGAPVVGGSAASAWRAWRRDTIAHPSPSAGRVEAAFAGALEIRLGGRTAYPYGVVELPVLGDGRNPDTGHVTRAVELSRVVGLLAAAGSALLAAALRTRRKGTG